PCAYKKETWLRLGGFAKELARGGADYDLHIAAIEAGMHVHHCGDVVYRYRVGHSGRVSKSYRLRRHETHEIMVDRHPEFFSDSDRRNRFLALGYRRAAISNLEPGDRV